MGLVAMLVGGVHHEGLRGRGEEGFRHFVDGWRRLGDCGIVVSG